MSLWVWILLNHIYGIIYACIHIWHMHFQMKKLSPVARLMITSAALRTLQHVHLKKIMQKRMLKNEAVVLRSSRKWVVSFASHLKWEDWLLGMTTFTNKGSCLEEDVKHQTNNEFLFPNIVQRCFTKIKIYIRNGTWQSSQFFTWARPWDMISLKKRSNVRS